MTMKKLALFLLATLVCGKAWSAPTISSLSGTFSGNADNTSANVITVSGTGFGTKSPAAPLIWATFNGSTVPTTLSQLPGGWHYSEKGEASSDSPMSGSGKLLSSSGWNTANFMVGLNLETGGYGSKVFVRLGRRLNFINDVSNRKFIRWWAVSGGSQPDIVFNNGAVAKDMVLSVEQGAGTFSAYPGGCNGGYSPAGGVHCSNNSHYGPFPPGQDTNWHSEQYFIQTNSANDAADARFSVWYDSMSGTVTGRKTDTAAVSGNYASGEFYVMDDPATGGATPVPASTATVSFDDLYIDSSWKRIYIANSSVLSTASVTEPGIPKAWSDTSVEFYFHQGRLANGSTNWVFVCDGSDIDLDDCSSGKQFFVGGAGSESGGGETTSNLAPSIMPVVGVSSFSVIWSSVPAAGATNNLVAVLSVDSNFATNITSGALNRRTTSYTNLAQTTTYYFKVKVATESDSGYSQVSTVTLYTPIPATIGSETQTSLTATWAGAFTANRAWDNDQNFGSTNSSGTATSPDAQGSLSCGTQYFFTVKVASETSYGGNVFSGTTSACTSGTTVRPKTQMKGKGRFRGRIK